MHYTLSVIIKDVNNLDSVLDKFDEDNELNLNPKWDWWVIGGRWPNSVIIKKDCNECIVGDNILSSSVVCKYDGYKGVDGAKIKDIDFEKMSGGKEKFYTFALLDEFGNWYEEESFNGTEFIQDKNYREEFNNAITKTDQNNYLIIVDYHD